MAALGGGSQVGEGVCKKGRGSAAWGGGLKVGEGGSSLGRGAAAEDQGLHGGLGGHRVLPSPLGAAGPSCPVP